MDADLEYWIARINEDAEKLRELKFYNLTFSQHSIEELYEIRETMENHIAHTSLLVDSLQKRRFTPTKPFWKKIFRK